MFGGTVSLPLVITPAMCIGNDDVGKSEVISTAFFISGLATLFQTTFGTRFVHHLFPFSPLFRSNVADLLSYHNWISAYVKCHLHSSVRPSLINVLVVKLIKSDNSHPSLVAVAQSVKRGPRVREVRSASQINNLSNWYLPLPSLAPSIIRIGQWLVGSVWR